MSLKNIHLLFIVVCTLLALFVTQWAFGEFMSEGGPALLASATLACLSATGIGVYGWRFQRRCRRLGLS